MPSVCPADYLAHVCGYAMIVQQMDILSNTQNEHTCHAIPRLQLFISYKSLLVWSYLFDTPADRLRCRLEVLSQYCPV